MIRRLLMVAAAAALLAACGGSGDSASTDAAPVAGTFTEVAQYPHDPAAFTQGLLVDGTTFLEGTGMVGRSELRRVEIATGRVTKRRVLPTSVFGEGVARVGDRIFQITWQDGRGFIWNAADFAPAGGWEYDGEGWGLTTMDDRLVMSDGSSTLRVLNPQTREVEREVSVTRDGALQADLNELEYLGDGRVAANIWMTTTIVVIDMETGRVTHTVDVADLAGRQPATANETNGIALAPDTGHWYVTGKNWPNLYEIAVDLPES